MWDIIDRGDDMKNIGLWLKAIKDRLETVRVSGQKDISTMATVLNTLDDLMGKAKQEAEQDEANNQ